MFFKTAGLYEEEIDIGLILSPLTHVGLTVWRFGT
jgi:hypothetical protein